MMELHPYRGQNPEDRDQNQNKSPVADENYERRHLLAIGIAHCLENYSNAYRSDQYGANMKKAQDGLRAMLFNYAHVLELHISGERLM